MQYGNFFVQAMPSFGHNSLNRTMQYGNILGCLFQIEYHLSLNRTMQYGNYLLEKLYFQKVRRFKSYYVVWKPTATAYLIPCPIGFKSYYVVWKHLKYTPFFRRYFLFKSYYVVWKRTYGAVKYPSHTSLNRTMQYGNF